MDDRRGPNQEIVVHRMLLLLCLGLLVPAVANAQIQSVTPSIIGAGSTPTVTFTGATPGAGHLVAFAPPGECATTRLATVPSTPR